MADLLRRVANLERATSFVSGLSAAQSSLVNGLVNGGMQIVQRGTSFALPNGTRTYTLDRWEGLRAATGSTVSQQTGPSPFNKVLRIQRDSGNTSVVDIKVAQSVETLEVTRFQGQRATLSFYARRGANLSSANGAVRVQVSAGTGTDQSHLGTVTGQTFPGDVLVPLTVDLVRYQLVVDVPANATGLAVIFTLSPTGTAGAADSIDVTGVQLEVGAAPSPFEHMPYVLTLWRCRRYYYRQVGNASNAAVLGVGTCLTTTSSYIVVTHPNAMRVAPTLAVSAASDVAIRTSATTTCSAVSMAAGGIDRSAVTADVASGLTAGHGAVLRLAVSASAWMEFVAEL